MDSNLTVADVRTAMARFSLPDVEFLRRLNRASERYLTSDIFYDLFTVVETTTATGYITVPRRYGRAYGVQIGDYASAVRGQWTEFVELGVGRQTPTAMKMDGLQDLGNHFCTQNDVWDATGEVSGTLRLGITNVADAAKTWRFFGTFVDTDGVEKRVIDTNGVEGVNLASVNPSNDTTISFKRVDGIQAPAGLKGMWAVSKVIAATPTQLGLYYPDERRPRYIRYKTATTTQTIRMYCRRAFVPLIADTDWVYPSNLDAIEQGFMACSFRDRGDTKAEENFWKAGKKALKEEYASSVPYPRIMLSSDFPGPQGQMVGFTGGMR